MLFLFSHSSVVIGSCLNTEKNLCLDPIATIPINRALEGERERERGGGGSERERGI